jgi:integrase
LLRQITSDFLQRYCLYLRDIRKISNKTYNDRLGNMHSCFETLRKLDANLWPDRNPCHRLEKLPTTTKTHAAYTTAQLNQFIEAIAPKDPQLLLFIRFIYYTLARPKELRFLKVGHIRSDFEKILFEGEHAKTDQEKYIGISTQFATVIAESGILNYPAEYYVFGNSGIPGQKRVGSSYFYKRFKVYLKELGFKKLNAAYTMYSFKHTGAVQLYLATKDVYLVQQQLRHTTLDQTNTYLRDLGLFVNFDGLKNWKGF